MDKYAKLFAFAEIFEKQANEPQGMLAGIGVPQDLPLTKEDRTAQAWLEKQQTKLDDEQQEVYEFLSNIKLDPSSGIARHIRGPITDQLNSLFARQIDLLRRTKKSKIPFSIAAREYADNKRTIKRLMNTIEEVIRSLFADNRL